MFHRWAALLLVLALCAMSPKTAAGQQQVPRGQSAKGKLGKNYPNPLNPETFWQFSVGDDACVAGSEQHVVSLQLYNALMQPVAVAVLQGPGINSVTALPGGVQGQRLANLKLPCGAFQAYWNGRLDGSGKEAPSGVYVARLIVDNQLVGTHKIFVSK